MKFDTIVKERANKRTQARIRAFQEAVIKAARTLTRETGGYPHHTFDEGGSSNNNAKRKLLNRSLLETMLAPPEDRRWPVSFWREEEDLVSKELLSEMDEMQRAIIASKTPRDADEAQPCEEVEEGTK